MNLAYQHINEEVLEDFTPLLQKHGVEDRKWLKYYCYFHQQHNQQILESVGHSGGAVTPGSIIGMGAHLPAATLPANTATGIPQSFSNGTRGSGDVFPNTMPVAVELAAQTIGLDLVSVIPMERSSMSLFYLEFPYNGGTISGSTKPYLFEIRVSKSMTVGTTYWGVSAPSVMDAFSTSDKVAKLSFVGRSPMNGKAIFKVLGTFAISNATGPALTADDTITLNQVFDGGAVIADDNSNVPDDTTANLVAVTDTPGYTDSARTHVAGFSGADAFDDGTWSGPFRSDDGNFLTGMERATSENSVYRTLGVKYSSAYVEAIERKTAITLTTQMLQDSRRNFGQNLVQMCKDRLIEEQSQDINKELLGYMFALGWTNHVNFNATEGANLLLNLNTTEGTTPTGSVTHYKSDKTQATINWPVYDVYGTHENQSSFQARLYSRIQQASMAVAHLCRFGEANFCVVGPALAAPLLMGASYTLTPMENSLKPNTAKLKPVGMILGNIALYIDQTMSWSDTRVLVGRKGADDEPGLKFCPYIMSEMIEVVPEATLGWKAGLISRYAVVPFGHNPQAHYMTFKVKLAASLA